MVEVRNDVLRLVGEVESSGAASRESERLHAEEVRRLRAEAAALRSAFEEAKQLAEDRAGTAILDSTASL